MRETAQDVSKILRRISHPGPPRRPMLRSDHGILRCADSHIRSESRPSTGSAPSRLLPRSSIPPSAAVSGQPPPSDGYATLSRCAKSNATASVCLTALPTPEPRHDLLAARERTSSSECLGICCHLLHALWATLDSTHSFMN